MIFLISIPLPVRDFWNPLLQRAYQISTFTAEIGFAFSAYLFCVELRISVSGEHPGIYFNLAMLGIDITCNFYDTRPVYP